LIAYSFHVSSDTAIGSTEPAQTAAHEDVKTIRRIVWLLWSEYGSSKVWGYYPCFIALRRIPTAPLTDGSIMSGRKLVSEERNSRKVHLLAP
jgi:hypothetical protein